MSYRRFAEQIETLEHRLSQMRQQGCTHQQALDLLTDALEQIRPHIKDLADADADRQVLRTFLDHIPEGIAIFDTATMRFRTSSKAGLALSGRDASINPSAIDYYSDTGVRLLHADGATPADLRQTPLLRAVEQGQIVLDEEWVLQRADGRKIPILCSAVPVRDESGRITAGVVTYRDISETKQIGKLLEQREQRYRSLFDYNLDAVFRLDVQGRLTEVNPAAVRLTGYPHDELLGMSIVELCAPEQRQRALAKFAEALGGQPADLEVAIYRKDGRRLEVYVTGGPIVVDGRTIGVFGIARDVTEARQAEAQIRQLNEQLERRVAERTASLKATNLELHAQIVERQRVERELRESESKYRGIVESTHDVIMLTRSDGIITYMSPSTREVLGYEPEELVGRQPWIIHPDDLDWARRVHNQALQGQAGSDVEYRVLTRSGEVKWISHSWSIISGSPHHTIVSVVRDITERKKAQAQIEQHETHLRALASELILAEERERRRIAIDLHDDLGQKLAVAKIRLSMLGRSAAGTDLEAPLHQLRQVIDEAMQSSRSLTFQICPPALYDLGLVPAAEWLAEDMLQRYGLQVQLADDGQPKPMDERCRVVLFRCLRELLINVAKHAGVNVAAVEIRRLGDTVQLSVEDTGSGFDPLKVVASSSRGGFGLFSIQERLGYIGGLAQIRSTPGQGTTVTLQVPVQLVPSQNPEGVS